MVLQEQGGLESGRKESIKQTNGLLFRALVIDNTDPDFWVVSGKLQSYNANSLHFLE